MHAMLTGANSAGEVIYRRSSLIYPITKDSDTQLGYDSLQQPAEDNAKHVQSQQQR